MKAMFRVFFLTALCLLLSLPALGADRETLYHSEYCFSQEDFAEDVGGILVRGVPDVGVAVIRLGDRCICAGDVLSAESLDSLRLIPCGVENCEVALDYQPIHGSTLGEPQQLRIRICSGKNEAPKAENASFETYKNIANDGTLHATDPEGSALSFQLVQKPKRGKVELNSDGSYVYTPDKNKVGEDSFTFTATDEAGNVSQPATVKIKILKPTEAMSFADMQGNAAQFEAMWASARDLTGGMPLAGKNCFCPTDAVSRAEFLAMAMELTKAEVSTDLTVSAFADAEQVAAWAQPYLAAAMRSGVIRGEVSQKGLLFRPNDPITGQEAAVILQNLLHLPVSTAAQGTSEPAWSAPALQALREAGISVEAQLEMTREKAVCLLYQVSKIK